MQRAYSSRFSLIQSLLSVLVAMTFSSCSMASIDMDREIELYNNALLDKDITGTAEVFRFNTTAIINKTFCDDCKQIKVIGIPDYSVYVNNAFVTSFHVQSLSEGVTMNKVYVNEWLYDSLVGVNGLKIIEKSEFVSQVFVSTDGFIESHFRLSATKNDFLTEHREFLNRYESVAPKLIAIGILVRESMQTKCSKSEELPIIMSENLMYVFLSAIHYIVSEDDIEFFELLNLTVREQVNCDDDEKWVASVRDRLTIRTKE